MNILLTGATGFLGSALLSNLSRLENIKVRAVVRKPVAIVPTGVIEVYCIRDLTCFDNWEHLLDGIDIVLHTVARAHIMHEKNENPIQEYRKVNVVPTEKLVKWAVKMNVTRFVFISSVKVNGESTLPGNLFNESSAAHPEDSYGISKLEAEEKIKNIAASSNLQYVIIRSPLVYGQNVKGNFKLLISLSKLPVPLPFGRIDNKRSMIFVENLVDFIILSMTHPKAGNEIFLVSDMEDVSTSELICRIRKSIGSSRGLVPFPGLLMKIIFKLLRRTDVMNRLYGSLQIDPLKARELLSWKPPYSFEEGIVNTVRKCYK